MKKLFTSLCLFAGLTLGYMTSNAETIYFQDGFDNGLGAYTLIDGDGLTRNSQLAQMFPNATNSWVAMSGSGNNYAASTSYFTSAGTADDWMISPEIEIGENAFIEWAAQGMDANYPDGYEIYVSDNGGTTKADFTTKVFSTANADGLSHAVNISDFGFKNEKIRFAIRNNSTDMFVLLFDQIRVYSPDAGYDLQLVDGGVSENVANGSTNTIPVLVYNVGTSKVNSFDITYQFDGEEPQTCTVTDPENLGYLEYNVFNHTTPWVPTKAGERTYTLSISNINGTNEADLNPNDNVASGKTFVYDETNSAPFTPLFEQFTASTCGPCYTIGTTYGLTTLLDNNVKDKGLVLVKYQMNWPGAGDPYYCQDGALRQQYYEVNSVPQAFGNGSAYEFTNESLTQAGMDKLYNFPGKYYIENPVFNVQDQQIIVKANLKPIGNTSSNVTAYVNVFENKTTGNIGSNGETEFHHVTMKMLPNGNGTKVTALTNGSEQEILFQETMAGTFVEEMDDLGVAIFVQDNDTKQILQAAYATKGGIDVPQGAQYDLQLTGYEVQENIPAGTPTKINYTIKNMGSEKVTSFDMTYQFEGDEAYTCTITNPTGFDYFEENTFTHTTDIVTSTTGNRNFTLSVGNINGTNPEDATPDNNVKTGTAYVYDPVAQAFHPLYESFTSSTCSPCYQIGVTYGMNNLLDKNVDDKGLVLVKYQMNWPGNGDPYFCNDGGMRQNYYAVNSVPMAFANGAGYEFTNLSLTQAGIDPIYNLPGKYNIKNPTFNIEGNNITVNAVIAPNGNTANNVTAYVNVFEFKTTGNKSSNGETEFHHVTMKMLPNGNGTKVTALTEGEQTLSLTADMSTTHVEEMNDLGVAIFIQDNNTKQILQAAYAVDVNAASGVNDTQDGSGIIGLYPNPASNNANLKYAVNTPGNVTIQLFDATGNNVYDVNVGNLAQGYYTYNFNNLKNLANGQYFVRLTIGGKAFNSVINIVR